MEVVKINYWYIWFMIIIICCIIIPRSNKLYLGIMNRKKKGRKRKMPQELMKEFIGKVCTIILFNESFDNFCNNNFLKSIYLLISLRMIL